MKRFIFVFIFLSTFMFSCSNLIQDLKWKETTPEGFACVEGGTFQMGNNNGRVYEKPEHTVTLSSFYMCDHEVTNEEWYNFMGRNPAWSYEEYFWSLSSRIEERPVRGVSWYETLVYCNKRSISEGLTPCYSIEGKTNPIDWGNVPSSSDATWDAVSCDFTANGYRLPTDAEWEYAARGGKKSCGYTYSGSNELDSVAWYIANCFDGVYHATHDVKTKSPNELGLYDMCGNVWEWTWDWYGLYSSDPQTNPTGPSAGSTRVLRGGCYLNQEEQLSITYRIIIYKPWFAYKFEYKDDAHTQGIIQYASHGFRVARSIR